MKELAKWVWLVLIAVLFVGPWIFVYIAAVIVIYFLLVWLKPEWIDKFWK